MILAVVCQVNAAIAKAAPGDIVNVAAGRYTGTGSVVVGLHKSVALKGGWDEWKARGEAVEK